jgi:ABC-2 type transport system ATP-binding protein
MATECALRARDLHKRFGSIRALRGVSLTVDRGQVVGFLGPNGAGKTTTIGIVLGLVHPTAGTVELFGEPVPSGGGRARRRVGALVGEPALLLDRSARQNLACAACLHPDLPAGRVDEMLEAVGLSAVAGRRVSGFSTGMKQRLGLAMAMLHRPDLLVLDAPCGGLDPEGVQRLRSLLRSLADQGTAILLSSHLLHEVELICDRVTVVHQGLVVADDSVGDLRNGFPERISITTDRCPETARALAELPGARDVVVSAGSVGVSGVPGAAVMRHLVASDLAPAEVTMVRPDLEAMFLQLTKEA